MTTIRKKNAKCGVCGAESEYTGIGSTNEFGSPDLDTRPPEMKRSTMFAWIHRCPDCGYCAPDIEKTFAGSSGIISSDDYRRQLNHPGYPELANTFLGHALLARNSGDLASAGLATMHAAWICDDDIRHADQSSECRKAAAQLLQLAEEKGQSISKQAGVTTAIRVDLLRRAGEPGKARELIAAHDDSESNEIIGRILLFQTTLIDRGDTDRHTIEEAMSSK